MKIDLSKEEQNKLIMGVIIRPVIAIEAKLKIVVTSSRLAKDQTSIAAVSIASFARWVIILNETHLYFTVTVYLCITKPKETLKNNRTFLRKLYKKSFKLSPNCYFFRMPRQKQIEFKLH